MAQRHESRCDREAAHTGAVEGKAERETTLLIEATREADRDRSQAAAGPAQPHDELVRKDLPQRRREAEADRACSEQDHAAEQHAPFAKPLDRPADPGQQQRAQQKAQRRRRAERRGRPVMKALQFLDVDRLPIGAEAPGEHRRGKRRDDRGPAALELAIKPLRHVSAAAVPPVRSAS